METAKRVRPGAPTDSVSKQKLRLWLKLLKTSKSIEAELREKLRLEFDTTLPRFDVMAALYRNAEGLKMSELSGELRVSNGNVTGIVDRLVEEGQVVRIPVHNDRRATTVRLTVKGRERFGEMAGRHELWIDDLLANLDDKAIDDLSKRLDQAMPTATHGEV